MIDRSAGVFAGTCPGWPAPAPLRVVPSVAWAFPSLTAAGAGAPPLTTADVDPLLSPWPLEQPASVAVIATVAASRANAPRRRCAIGASREGVGSIVVVGRTTAA